MTYKSKAVSPFMGEEIEWAIQIRDLDGRFRLPTFEEMMLMINIFRKFINLPLIDKKNALESTTGLSGEEDWKYFLRRLRRNRLSADQGFLPSGFRYYIDGHHLETSSPGCSSLKDLVISSKAAEMMVNFSRKVLEETVLPKDCAVKVFKDTSNRKDTSFAGHENYLINEDTFFEVVRLSDKTMQLASFFAVRVPLHCAGQIFLNRNKRISFQISQRAHFIKKILNLDTTYFRPLVNTRNEPHADFVEQNGVMVPVKRLHVICGEPNMSPTSMKMRFGTTLNFLQGLQDNIFDDIQDDIILKNPVRAIKIVSSDVGCKKTVELASGKKVKFYEILRAINDKLRWYFDEIREPTEEQKWVLDKVDYYCDAFEKGPRYYMRMLLPELDWVNRFDICDSVFEKSGTWSGLNRKKAELLYFNDLSYADIDPESGLYHKMEGIYREEGLIKEEFTQKDVKKRVYSPPEDNREYLRGKTLKMLSCLRSDWGVVLLPSGKILWLGNPFKGSKKEIGDFERFSSEDVLIKELTTLGFKLFDR